MSKRLSIIADIEEVFFTPSILIGERPLLYVNVLCCELDHCIPQTGSSSGSVCVGSGMYTLWNAVWFLIQRSDPFVSLYMLRE